MGKFDVYGGYFAPDGYFRINEGGSHEENPNGGVQVGVDENGTPNVLEEGEPVYNDFVYSDNIYADGGVLEKYHIPKKYAGKLYSKIADSYVSEAEERPNDPTSNRGLEVMLGRLADAQEEQKAIEQQKELEKELDSMSPEQLAQLEQILSEQAIEQYPDAGVPQEQMPVQMNLSPEEQQMMMDQQMPQQMPMDDQSAMMAQQGGMPVMPMAYGGNMYEPGGAIIPPLGGLSSMGKILLKGLRNSRAGYGKTGVKSVKGGREAAKSMKAVENAAKTNPHRILGPVRPVPNVPGGPGYSPVPGRLPWWIPPVATTPLIPMLIDEPQYEPEPVPEDKIVYNPIDITFTDAFRDATNKGLPGFWFGDTYHTTELSKDPNFKPGAKRTAEGVQRDVYDATGTLLRDSTSTGLNMGHQMGVYARPNDPNMEANRAAGMPYYNGTVGFSGRNTRARGGRIDGDPKTPWYLNMPSWHGEHLVGASDEEIAGAKRAAQNAIDAAHIAAYAVPYVGNGLMAYDLGSDLYRGDYDDAAIDASFLAFPWIAKSFKELYKASKAASKTSKAAAQVPMKAMSLGGSLYDYDENIYAPGGPIKSVLKALRKAWKVARADKEVKNAAKEFTNARKTAEQMNRSKRILDQAKLSGSAEKIVKAEDNFKYWQDQTKNAFKSSANARNAMSGRSVAGTSAGSGTATAAAEGVAEGTAAKTAKKTRKQLLEEANKRSEEAKKAGNNGWLSWTEKDFWNRMPQRGFWGTLGREVLPGHDIVRGIRRSNVLGNSGWGKAGTIALNTMPEAIKAGTGFGLYGLFAPSVRRGVNNISDAYSFVNGDLSDNVSDTSYVSPISEDRYDVYAYGGPMNTFGEGGKADDKQKRLQEIVDRVKYTGYMSESDNAYIGSLKGDVPMNIANYLRTNTKGVVPDSSFPELTYTGRGAVAYPEDNRKSIGRQIIDAITPTKETFRSIGNLISDSIPTKEEVEAAKDRAREATENFFSGWGDIMRNSLVGSQAGYNDKEGFSLGYIPEEYGSPGVNLSFNDNPVAITTNDTNNSVSTKSVPASSGNASVNTAAYSGNNNSAPAVTTTNVKSATVKPSAANPAVKTTAVKPATATGIPEPEIDYNITLPEYRDPRVDLLPSIAPVSENNAARNYARDIQNMNDLQNRNDLDWYVRNRMRDRVKDRSRQDWKRIENNVKSKYKEQPKENEYKGLSTWPRYAGILGAGVQALWNAAHPADKYHIPTYNPVLPEGRMHLVDPVFNPLDENMAVNNVLNANAAAVYGLANSSLGPSAGANILAADYNASKNIGNAMGSVWDMNNQRRNDVIRQRNENGQLLGNFRWGINNTRAGILNDAMLKNYQNSLLQQRLNNMAESEKYAAINSNLDAMYEGAAGIGKENFAINQINSNRALDYYLRNIRGVSGYKGRANYGKCGGTLLKKYKK